MSTNVGKVECGEGWQKEQLLLRVSIAVPFFKFVSWCFFLLLPSPVGITLSVDKNHTDPSFIENQEFKENSFILNIKKKLVKWF